MNTLQRKKVFRQMIKVIDDEGSARCGWGCDIIYGKGKAPEHEIEKLAGMFTRGNKFIKSIRTKSGTRGDYWISRNPLYELERMTIETYRSNIKSNERLKWTNLISLIIAGLTLIFISAQVFRGCKKEGKEIYKTEKTTPIPQDTVQRNQINPF